MTWLARAVVLLTLVAGMPQVEAATVVAGTLHSCQLSDSGTVNCWGDNGDGQLGLGDTGGPRPTPQAVPALTQVTALSAGSHHTCALIQGGTVRCWGANHRGQLGLGVAGGARSTPQIVPALTNVTALSAGGSHTCVLIQDGTVKCWGYNYYGQLGLGEEGTDHPTPQSVPSLINVAALSAGVFHTCALIRGGTVKCWGSNVWGQLGVGLVGGTFPTPEDLPELTDVTALSAGAYHNCALIRGGMVKCWGDNSDGQLGVEGGNQPTPSAVATLTDVTAIGTGRSHTCARIQGGTVKCWGGNQVGQLGLGLATGALRTPRAVPALSNVTVLSAGDEHTCALILDGTTKCWGNNGRGQLGLGVAGGAQPTPEKVSALTDVIALSTGSDHTCALIEGGTVQCWGSNSNGQLGRGDSGGAHHTPQAVAGLADVTALSAGFDHTCALIRGGIAKCWGDNHAGQLGFVIAGGVQATPQAVSGLTNVIALSAGSDFTCALIQGGTVKCWGSNSSGQLGVAGADQPTPQAVPALINVTALSAGGNHICALIQGGTVQCWGSNSNGQLGLGETGGAHPTPRAVALAGNVQHVDAGRAHTCAQLVPLRPGQGQLYCWGFDGFGQLGNGSASAGDRPTPHFVVAGLPLFAVGFNSSCSRNSGTVYCWGENGLGQLGRGDRNDVTAPAETQGFANAAALAIGAGHICAINADSTVACAGSQSFGQLGNGVMGYSAVPQVVGSVFSNGFE